MPTPATISTAAEMVLENATAKRARMQAQRADTTTPLAGGMPIEDLPADLPDVRQATSAKPARPATLAEAATWLLRPFPQAVVELKPTATTRDKSKALACPYVDMRIYFGRLDKICGLENWSHAITLTDRGAVCALTIFGVTKSATGDYPQGADENPATSAEAQAFKRACAAFGLGRYLYSLPQVWAEYDEQKKQIVDVPGTVARMYASLPKGDE
jgi:hypothetical protein